MKPNERLRAFQAHGHDVRLLTDGRFVLRLNGRWFRIVGGDFRHPSLIALPAPPPPRAFRGEKG